MNTNYKLYLESNGDRNLRELIIGKDTVELKYFHSKLINNSENQNEFCDTKKGDSHERINEIWKMIFIFFFLVDFQKYVFSKFWFAISID